MHFKRLILAVSLITILLAPGLAYAAGGDGSGGGGGDNPLTLTGAYLTTVNGSTSTTAGAISGVSISSTQPIFKFVFSLNVVDDSVWPSPNQGAFSLQGSSSGSIPIEVFRIDPNVNRDERNNIFIRPSGSLPGGEQYIISLNPALKGKNGHTLGESTGGQGTSVSFTTVGSSTSAQNSSATDSSTSSQQGAAFAAPTKKSSGSFDDKQLPVKFKPTGGLKSVRAASASGSPIAWWTTGFVLAAISLIVAAEGYVRFTHKKLANKT